MKKSEKINRYYKGKDDWKYKCTSAYKPVENVQNWSTCPMCGLYPKVWEFTNGRSTACGCGKNDYDHHSIHAESIVSVFKNSTTGSSSLGYDVDALRKNWNRWCNKGEIVFPHSGKRNDGRW